MSLAERLIKNSTIKQTATLTDSKVYGVKEMIPTAVPMVNVAFSGRLDGGFVPGLTMLAGPSKHFKSGFALLCIKAFLDKHDDGVVLFYDSEFGTPQGYFKTFGIDLDNVIHTPITNVEELKHDIMSQLEEITEKDNVLIICDSVGNLASKKEVEDAIEGKSVADMTRAKALKSLGRMITPHLSLKSIPMIAVNHTYKEIGLYPKDIVGGGTGLYYSADTIWILGRSQDKDGKDIKGYHFTIRVEKSRFVKENSKIPISISWEGGINKWSGLLENAMEHGVVIKPKIGWYSTMINGTQSEKSYREKDLITNKSIWDDIFKQTDLAEYIKEKYTAPESGILGDDEENED